MILNENRDKNEDEKIDDPHELGEIEDQKRKYLVK